MQQPKVYTAGPQGFSEIGRVFHNDVLVPSLEEFGFEVLDPWKLTPDSVTRNATTLPYGLGKREMWRAVNRIIGKNNADAIEASDLVFAVLDGTDVDSGTAAEIGYAAALKKPIIGYRGDFRLSSDNEGSTVNLQVQYFIESTGGRIQTDYASARTALMDWVELFVDRVHNPPVSLVG